MPAEGQYYRAGVGALIINGRSEVLAFERSDVPGMWQMPQGGLEAGEEPTEAIWREVLEETGLSSSDLRLIGRYPDLLAYELPPGVRGEKTGRGQVHHWFFFRIEASETSPVKLNEEFRSWGWLPMEELIERTADFRRPVYQKLLAHFRTIANSQPD